METNDAVYTFRLPVGELQSLKRAAAARGMPVSQFIREAIAGRMSAAPVRLPQAAYTIGTPHASFSTCATWTEGCAIVFAVPAPGHAR